MGFVYAQKSQSVSIADCAGAMNIFKSGTYQIQFTGESGSQKEFVNYPSLIDFSEENIVWISYIPEFSGKLSFDASVPSSFLQIIIFEEGKKDICGEISSGVSEILRINKAKSNSKVGLNEKIDASYLYPLTLKAGKKILIGFSTEAKLKSTMQLNFNFIADNKALEASSEVKVVDFRDDEFAPSYKIVVKNKDSKQPVIANVSIEGIKELSGNYNGSEINFNIVRGGKANLKIDAEGFFFCDTTETIVANVEKELVIYLDPVSKGKTMRIEEIEFQPGSSEFLQGADVKLRRLKDFMALNANISIEVQGHVFEQAGENSVMGQKLSEARAKKVVNYLIENGIDKSRMTFVGYGSTKPIYLKPKFAYEEQANRRVEIVVK